MSEEAGPTNPAKQSATAPASNGEPRASKLATASFVTGLLAFCILPLALAAVIFGVCGLIAIRNAKGALTGKGKALAGLVLGCAALILIPPLFLAATFKGREAAKLANCQNNLKQQDLVFKRHIFEHKGRFPNLSSVPGNLVCDRSLYPDYASNLSCFRHARPGWFDEPLTPETAITDQDYFYLGYCMTSDAEVAAFVEAYRQACQVPGGLDGDLKVAPGKGNAGSDTLYHLREGLERFFVTDASNPAAAAIIASKIPVVVERPAKHVYVDVEKSRSTGTWKREPGSCVLYLDGHVDFVAYPGRFPMTEATITALESLSPYGAQ